MNLHELTEQLQKVSEIYAKKFDIKTNADWYVLKLQEELGELVASHLKLSQRARTGEKTPSELKKNFEEEIADVLAICLLLSKHQDIDVEQAIRNKWLQYLPDNSK